MPGLIGPGLFPPFREEVTTNEEGAVAVLEPQFLTLEDRTVLIAQNGNEQLIAQLGPYPCGLPGTAVRYATNDETAS